MKPVAALACLLSLAAAPIPSSPELGKAEGRCRAGEKGPALIVSVEGLKDRRGMLKLEIYPSNDEDFLQDDNILVAAGKTFRRVETLPPASGPVELCVRLPGPGAYSASLLHDRDSNRKFGLSSDGIAFPGNPKLGWRKPKAESARFIAGTGMTRATLIMNYRTGIASFGPLRRGG